ncbi:MAG: SusC/RagA family TonB-linked outer membrane protein [Fimbriimonadaceae bacterium]|nr:SusC/RagA family TonB-linked outer membrane protein [Chitinophagales bacterium]
MRSIYKLLLVLLVCTSFQTLFAQMNISGVVTDKSNEPLIGVTVVVKNTTNGTVTDVDGKYSLTTAGSPATLVFSYIGFSSVEQTVTASGTVNMLLEETNSLLDAVVVSGLATSVKRSNLANSVDQITAKQLTGITQQSTLDGALYGKFTGAQIISNSGSPGGGFNIRLRGLTSINGAAQPLFIIDGIYVDNSAIPAGLNFVSAAAAGGNNAQFYQDNASNRIADIDPDEVESIEILKGAAAAAIYGSRASGGVVIITTKRGKATDGRADIQLSQTTGYTQIINPQGMRDWDAAKVEASYGPDEVVNFNNAVANGGLIDYENELFGNIGLLSNTHFSVSGGAGKTSYYASAGYKNEEGIVPNTGYEKTSVRLNTDTKLTNRIKLSLSNNFIKSSADRGFFNNDNTTNTMSISLAATPVWAQLFPDENGNYPDNPYSASNFLQTAALMTNNEAVNRYLGGANADVDLFSNDKQSLHLVLNGGVDFYNFATSAIFPRELQFEKNGAGTNGASIQGSTNNFNNNEAGFLVHTYYTESGTSFRTQLGLTREQFYQNQMLVYASELIGSQTTIDQAGAVSTYQNIIKQLDKGGFIQEEVNLNDKVFLTAGVRADKSSNNGDPNKLYFFPKASVALTLSEFDFWTMGDRWDFAKLRIAYGQSGNFAPFGSIYTPLESTNIGGLAGSLVGTQKGKEDIGPEIQSEIEFGFDLGFINSRIILEATYYIKTVSDLLLIAALPESSGFTSQIANAADMQNTGIELSLGTEIIRTEKLNWYSKINFWMNRSEVTRLDIPEFAVGSFGTTLGTFYIQEGASATQLVGVAPIDSTSNPDGLFPLDVTGDNLPAGLDKYGDTEPDFQMSFNEELTYGNWSLSCVLHWKKGGDNVNLTQLLTDIFSNSADYDDYSLGQSTTLPDGSDSPYTNGIYRLTSIGVSSSTFVQDASYVRLREVGLYYTFDGDKISNGTNDFMRGIKVGVSAYNALNFFDYGSYDPEVSNFGSNGISTGIEVNPFPSAKRFYGHVIFNF